MELKDFRTLLEIERLGSISLAARTLYVSQPGLSQFLQNYEQSLGFPVFERISHGVRPTARGKAYLGLVRSLVETYDREFAKMKGEERRLIRFGIGDQRGALLIPTLMSTMDQFRQEFELEINDTISSRNNLLAALKDNMIDAACTTVIDEDYRTIGNIRVVPLLKEEILLVVPKQHELVGRLHRRSEGEYWVEPGDLNHQTYILCNVKREIRKMSDWIFRSLDVTDVNVLQSSTSLFTVINSCLNCNALTFSPWEYICHSEDCVCASVGERGVYWTHILMARPEAFQGRELEQLMGVLKESFVTDMRGRHVILGEESEG